LLNDNEQLLPSSIVDLHADHNRIKHLSANTLSNLQNLKYLNLEANQISSIEQDAFTYLTQLTQIHLAKNFLKIIPQNVFFTLIELQRLDLSSQNQALKQIDDYAFDRRANSREITKIDLSNNGITMIGNKAFCSRNRSHSYINIKEIDLAQNPLLRSINSCILNQLAKGFSEFHGSSNLLLTNQQPKVSFKPAPSFEAAQTVSMQCDCEIAKSALLVNFEGECVNEQNNKVELIDFKCTSDLTKEQVEESCQELNEYNCEDQGTSSTSSSSSSSSSSSNTDEISTFKQGVSEAASSNTPSTNNNNNHNNDSRPPSSASSEDSQKNKNTKLPVRAEVNVNLNENKANVKSSCSALSYTLFVIVIALIV
jgi:hypothetical protein